MNDTTAATFIGIDVHARSAAACAINGLTGEIERTSFGAGYTAAGIAEWALGFERPAAVYEAGCTGFWLARGLRELGVPCAVGAPSKMQRPPADARKKNDRSDAEFLARLLSMRNVREVAVPDEECEAARDLCRARADAAADLTRARQRLNLFLMRRGHVYCERAAGGSPKASWSKGWWAWMRSIDLGGDSVAFDYYVSEVRHAAKGVKPGDTYPPGILSAPLPISRHDRTTPYRSRRTPLRQTGRLSWQTSPYQAYRTHRPSQGASCIQILVSLSS